jgi:internalin A
MPMSSPPRSFLASPEGRALLQAANAERGLTFAAIAELAGVSADTVSRLFHPEQGKRVNRERVSATHLRENSDKSLDGAKPA